MSHDLISASRYLNNQLLSRGLLPDGEVAFADPSKDEGAPGQIINLVHNFLKRRDKDAEQRENLALTIRTLKADEAKTNTANERLKTRCEELERKCGLLQNQERILNASVRTAEATAKSLREEAARAKTMLQQVKTQCANDLRKRDFQISKMKERLLDTTRGGRGNKQPLVFPGVTLSATASTMGSQMLSNSQSSVSSNVSSDNTILTKEYEMSQDTIKFLTEFSQSLSDENETLTSMIRSAISTIKASSGLAIGDEDEENDDELITATDTSHSVLNEKLEDVLDNLRLLLNQPNYVPIEDLAAKDEEIAQIREQARLMMDHWRAAIKLVDEVNSRPEAKPHTKKIQAVKNTWETQGKIILDELDINIPSKMHIGGVQIHSVPHEPAKTISHVQTVPLTTRIADQLANLSRIQEESMLEKSLIQADETLRKSLHDKSEILQYDTNEDGAEEDECDEDSDRTQIQDNYQNDNDLMLEDQEEMEDDDEEQEQEDSTIEDEIVGEFDEIVQEEGKDEECQEEEEEDYIEPSIIDDIPDEQENHEQTVHESSMLSESLEEVELVPNRDRLEEYMEIFSPVKLTSLNSKKRQTPQVLRAITPLAIKKKTIESIRRTRSRV